MSLLSTSDGNGMVVETIFENRFAHIPELCRMGAKIKTEGNAAFIEGVKRLSGAGNQQPIKSRRRVSCCGAKSRWNK